MCKDESQLSGVFQCVILVMIGKKTEYGMSDECAKEKWLKERETVIPRYTFDPLSSLDKGESLAACQITFPFNKKIDCFCKAIF